MPADVNLNIDINKKGEGDKEAAAGLELVAKAADDAKDELAALDRKLLETRAAMVAAGKTFSTTGDISPFKALQKDARELGQVRKAIASAVADAEKAAASFDRVGSKTGTVFSDGFFKGVKQVVPRLFGAGLQGGDAFGEGFLATAGKVIVAGGPVLIPAIAALTAAAGAALAGGILAGTGLGAIATGIALQFKSPLVHDAATSLGDYVKDELTKATSGFGLKFAEGITALKREAEPLFVDIRQGLTSLEPYVANLLARLGEGLAKLGPGLGRALEAAGPVLGALSKNIPTLLNAVGIFFEEISRGGKGAALAIDAITKTVAGLIVELGKSLYVASKVFEGMAIAGDKVTGILAKIPGIGKEWEALHNYVHGVAVSFQESQLAAGGASAAINGTAGAAQKAAEAFQAQQAAAQALRNQIDGLISASLGLAGADLQLRTDEAGLVDLHKQNGAALQGNSAQALANQQAFLGLARDLEATRQAEIAHGASLQEANAHLQANADALVNMATKAGFDRGQVEALISSMLAIPNVNRTIQIDEIRTHTDIYRVIDQTGNITGGSPYQRSASQLGLQAFGGIVAAARGLIASSKPAIVFGERTLPEAYIPAPNSGISQGRADALLGTAASWWGRRMVPAGGGSATTHRVVLQWPNGEVLADIVLDPLRNKIRVLGGGNVQAVLGR